MTAERLARTRTWDTAAGSTLTVAAGDWWVVGADGSVRGVAADRFGDLYEPLGGDRYRRRGEVRARRAEQAEEVPSLEGSATARPGDWVVDDGTSRWPVPADEFERGYEPLG